jgi:hypothetical protein
MSLVRPLLAGAVVAASFADVQAADAACHGSQQFALVCVTTQSPYYVDPSGGTVEDCIVVNSDCLVPYSVDTPAVRPRPGATPVTVTCTGQLCN